MERHHVTAKRIDGKALAGRIRGEISEQVQRFLQETSITPHLAAVLVGDDPASAIYVRNKQRACDKAGIKSTLHHLSAETSQDELLELIGPCNDDERVHGILVQLPLPPQIDAKAVLDAISPLKDVDGLHPENVGLMVQNRPRFLPCTPHGIQRMLIDNGTQIEGADVVILGRSEIVGKPMALLLMQKQTSANATVTVCHSRTRDLPAITRRADILIAAIGSPRFVTADMVKPAAVVIDVGTNRVDDRWVGDVDYPAVCEIASAITPVPGGVGPMTIAMLLDNTLTAAKLAANR
jgi:methylenetetrahydrofolate dehydrogenase (NADP+)/methenyltetrahydrofolate cyclohydrolase